MAHFPTHVQLQRDDNDKRVRRLYVAVKKWVQPEINQRHGADGLPSAAMFFFLFLTAEINNRKTTSLLFFFSFFLWAQDPDQLSRNMVCTGANQLSRMKARSQSYHLRSFFKIWIFIVERELTSEPRWPSPQEASLPAVFTAFQEPQRS